jgi:hypothetical protein
VSGYVCATCQDTHVMQIAGRDVPCTRCPRPCPKCREGRVGGFCATTPCACGCHVAPAAMPSTAPGMRKYEELVAILRAARLFAIGTADQPAGRSDEEWVAMMIPRMESLLGLSARKDRTPGLLLDELAKLTVVAMAWAETLL